MTQEITKDTVIDYGLQISKNFLLSHLSTGAYHPNFAEWLPRFSSKLIPRNENNLFTEGGQPIWKIARSLQLGSQNILETLMKEVGPDLIIRSGFMNNGTKEEKNHTMGKSIDIAVRSYEDNAHYIANDIQKLCKSATNISMTFSNNCWFHIDYSPTQLANGVIVPIKQTFKTIDLQTGVIEKGITSIRGLF